MAYLSKEVLQKFEEYCRKHGIEGKKKEELMEKLKQLIVRYLYEPGEAIGVVAAQSISEPATQMSLDAKEKIIIKHENKIISKKIGEFVDSLMIFGKKIDDWDVIDLSDYNIFAYSIAPDGSTKWSRVLAASRHSSPKKLLKVTTKSGKQIIATDSHSFLLNKNNLILPVSGKELKSGYKIPMADVVTEDYSADSGSQMLKLKRIKISEMFWDEIISIEYIKSEYPYVYDFTVEETETFMTSEGIFTHNTMRSYTLASQSDRLSKVTQGLPRLIEIFDARKTFEKNMIIYLKEEYNSKEKAKEIANRMKSVKVQDVILSDSIDLIDMQIELELEGEKHKEQIKSMVSKYVKEAGVSFRGGKVYIKPKESDVKNLRKIKNKVLKMHIDGIKGIENVVVVREGDDWVIQTAGTNLKKVLQINEVDAKRTRTNDVHQIFEILGIEAARNVILQEAKDTLDEQGLEVDVRHLMLLADIMTFTGEVRDIGRYGVSGKKASVLARANFEETKRHLINASFYGEKDSMDGIIENVLVGQLAPIGTGMVELTMDLSKMKKKK